MALTNYEYEKRRNVFHAISEGYQQADDHWGIPGAASGFGQYVINNKLKTSVVFLVISSAIALTTAYFMSPAYAVLISTTAKSAYVGMVEGGKGLYAFAAANPVFTGLLAAAIVGTIGILAYKHYSQSSEIKKRLNKAEIARDNFDQKSALSDIAEIVGYEPQRSA